MELWFESSANSPNRERRRERETSHPSPNILPRAKGGARGGVNVRPEKLPRRMSLFYVDRSQFDLIFYPSAIRVRVACLNFMHVLRRPTRRRSFDFLSLFFSHSHSYRDACTMHILISVTTHTRHTFHISGSWALQYFFASLHATSAQHANTHNRDPKIHKKVVWI